MKRILLAMNVLASLSVAARAADGGPDPKQDPRRTFHYGRVEFRAQMPRERGAWPALWFLGDCIRQKGDAYSPAATGPTAGTPSASRCSSS